MDQCLANFQHYKICNTNLLTNLGSDQNQATFGSKAAQYCYYYEINKDIVGWIYSSESVCWQVSRCFDLRGIRGSKHLFTTHQSWKKILIDILTFKTLNILSVYNIQCNIHAYFSLHVNYNSILSNVNFASWNISTIIHQITLRRPVLVEKYYVWVKNDGHTCSDVFVTRL